MGIQGTILDCGYERLAREEQQTNHLIEEIACLYTCSPVKVEVFCKEMASWSLLTILTFLELGQPELRTEFETMLENRVTPEEKRMYQHMLSTFRIMQ